jgi:hypothetical protein
VTRLCQEDEQVEYIEADISAYSPRMQRTLLELGYLPAAYIPSMTFHRVERLDAIRMVKLLAPLDTEKLQLHDTSAAVANIVIREFSRGEISPSLTKIAAEAALFEGLDKRQAGELAAICTPVSFASGDILIEQGAPAGQALLILSGSVAVSMDGNKVGSISTGETLGEISLLKDLPHNATATALDQTEAAALDQTELQRLIRRRPDIGVVLYRNLATQLGDKLLRADRQIIR